MNLASLPGELAWRNQPLRLEIASESAFSITAGPETDWFIDPSGGVQKSNAPIVLFTPPDKTMLLSARLQVEFKSTFDAGVLFLYENDDTWAKLCFEYSPQSKPMIVSVVTHGLSDDCNSVMIENDQVYLRVYRHENIFAYHYSVDGRYWNLVRYFNLGPLQNLQLGFSAQSPTGPGCKVRFSDINYNAGKLGDLRNGT